MAPTLRRAAGLLLAGASVATASWLPNIVARDVAIVGGGASGAYAAVRLREHFGQSVVVIEKAGRMGGHVATYQDPMTGLPFDFGVQSYNNYGPASAFFQRMNVSVGSAPRVPLLSRYVDFTTGLPVNFTPPANADRIAALQRFLNVTAPYENLTLPGYWNFPQPSQIPPDLLLPFGQFATKYGIQAAVNQVFEVTGLGPGDMINTPTMYVLGAFGQPMIRAFIGQGSTFTPTSRRNIQLYEAVQNLLGDDVLLNSTVVQSLRTDIGHSLWVRNANGDHTIVLARRLLMAVEPTPANTAPFNLDWAEQSVFSKFSYSSVHAGIVTHPSLPANVSLVNLPAAAAPANYLALPTPDLVARFDYMGAGSNLFRVLLVGNQTFDAARAQALVRSSFAKMAAAGTLPSTASTADPRSQLQFVAWADHGAMHMRASVPDIKAGFIQQLYSLQGRRATWWTGGAFSVQFQAILWAFDDILLPKMLAK